jgi:tetratricopeptide (TPR) repeat protein
MAKPKKKSPPPKDPAVVRKGCRSGLNMLALSVLLTVAVAIGLSWVQRGRVNDPFSAQIREAEAHLEEGAYEEAITIYSDIITQDPSHVLAHWSRGVTYFEAGGFEQAIADYSWVIEQGETANAIIYLLRAEAYVANGQTEQAAADYEAILASDADEELKAEAAAALQRLE